MSARVAADAVVPEHLRPEITDPLPYLGACERRHLNALKRRVEHLRERLADDDTRPGSSWDRGELRGLEWSLSLALGVVRERTEVPLSGGCRVLH